MVKNKQKYIIKHIVKKGKMGNSHRSLTRIGNINYPMIQKIVMKSYDINNLIIQLTPKPASWITENTEYISQKNV